MSEIHSILFDLDGTLLDTAPDLIGALNAVLESHGRSRKPLEVARPYVSRGARGLLQCGFELDQESEQYLPYVEEFLAHYRNQLCDQSSLFEGVDRLLDDLDNRRYSWGVVTNKATALTEPLLKQMNLYDRLHVLVCGDTLAEKKPSPKPLLHACGVAGMLPEDTIYVGDDPRYILAQIAAVMVSVAASYGYYDVSENPNDWGADRVIDHPSELGQMLA